ncbi:MAG: hypothetical protein WD688_23110 [Candidatus Binatia bacterium]
MKTTSYVSVLTIANMLLASVTGSVVAAGQEKDSSQASGRASAHASSKGTTNGNAQWSADPDRGWVRADERHQSNAQNDSSAPKQTRGKHKKGGKSKKTFESSN